MVIYYGDEFGGQDIVEGETPAKRLAEEQKLQDEKLNHAADNLIKLGLAPRGTFASEEDPQKLDKAELKSVLEVVQAEMQKQGAVKGTSMDDVYAALDATVVKKDEEEAKAALADASKEAPKTTAPAAAPPKAAAAKPAQPKLSIPFRDEDMVMQAQLRLLGETEVGNIDGRKGPKTNAAMESFARKNGLEGADEKTIRTKINEKYTALGVTAARIDDLVTSGDINDKRAGQVAFNLQHPNAQVKVAGLDNDVNRTASAARAPVAVAPAVASVAMPTTSVPPTVTAPEATRTGPQVPVQTQPAQGEVQQRSYGTVQQPGPTQEQLQMQQLQRQNQELAERNQNQKQMIEEMRSPQNIEVGRRGSISGYYNQEAGRMGGGMTPAEMQYRLREKQMDQNFELRDRQISMQETRGYTQIGVQLLNAATRYLR